MRENKRRVEEYETIINAHYDNIIGALNQVANNIGEKPLTPEEIGCKVVPADQVHVHGGYNSRDFLMMIHARNADTKERLRELVKLGNPFAKKKLDEIENEEKKKQQPKHID